MIIGFGYFINACTLSLGIGAYAIVFSITKEIRRILRSIKCKVQAKKTQPNELKLPFSEYIHTHAAIKQLI